MRHPGIVVIAVLLLGAFGQTLATALNPLQPQNQTAPGFEDGLIEGVCWDEAEPSTCWSEFGDEPPYCQNIPLLGCVWVNFEGDEVIGCPAGHTQWNYNGDRFRRVDQVMEVAPSTGQSLLIRRRIQCTVVYKCTCGEGSVAGAPCNRADLPIEGRGHVYAKWPDGPDCNLAMPDPLP